MVMSAYEEARLKRLEENKKRMAELNIHKLAQSLHTPKPSPPVLKPRVSKQPVDPNHIRRSSRVAVLPPVSYKYNKRPKLTKIDEDEDMTPATELGIKKACPPRRNGKRKIGDLSDEILGYILSFLTMKEARRTSVLSKRWRYVWSYMPTLDFDSCDIHPELGLGKKPFEVEELKYLRCVEQVVCMHKAPTIDEFRVRFDINYLGSNSTGSINNWFTFAMGKKVKRLEIDLSEYSGGSGQLRHTFSSSSLCDSLTSLELGCVNVTGDILESFLSNCLALEHLSVKYSESLVGLSVSSLSLKSFRIYRCNGIGKLQISAPNLVSFCYTGRKINVQFKNMLKLVEVSIGDEYAGELDSSFADLSGYHTQIEVLSLHPRGKIKNIRISGGDPVFTRLEKLDLEVSPCWNDDLCSLMSLMKAFPSLQHLKLVLTTNSNHSGHREGLKKPDGFPHNELKIVEIVGFVGYPIDMEIATLLIESAISLDKIIVDPGEVPGKCRARSWAGRLRRILKPGTKLEIM